MVVDGTQEGSPGYASRSSPGMIRSPERPQAASPEHEGESGRGKEDLCDRSGRDRNRTCPNLDSGGWLSLEQDRSGVRREMPGRLVAEPFEPQRGPGSTLLDSSRPAQEWIGGTGPGRFSRPVAVRRDADGRSIRRRSARLGDRIPSGSARSPRSSRPRSRHPRRPRRSGLPG